MASLCIVTPLVAGVLHLTSEVYAHHTTEFTNYNPTTRSAEHKSYTTCCIRTLVLYTYLHIVRNRTKVLICTSVNVIKEISKYCKHIESLTWRLST